MLKDFKSKLTLNTNIIMILFIVFRGSLPAMPENESWIYWTHLGDISRTQEKQISLVFVCNRTHSVHSFLLINNHIV